MGTVPRSACEGLSSSVQAGGLCGLRSGGALLHLVVPYATVVGGAGCPVGVEVVLVVAVVVVVVVIVVVGMAWGAAWCSGDPGTWCLGGAAMLV